MGKGKNVKKNRKQEIVINIISITVLIAAVAIIIMNISADKEEKSADMAKPVNFAQGEGSSDSEVAGIPISDMKMSEQETDGESEAGSVDNNESESTGEGASESDTEMPYVAEKEYSNVTSGKLTETDYVSDDYFNNTLFLGDSRTVALKTNGFILEKNTFAVNGISHVSFLTQQFTDSVTGVTGDIFSIVKERKPDKIYVALGVNGVAFIEKDTFLSRYEELIDRLMAASPESKIIIQCILPVNEKNYTGGNPDLNNKNIDNMNAELLKLAEKKGIFYLDISYLIKDGNNSLGEVYDSGDGLHFSFTGYSTVYDGICKHGVD